MGDCFWYSTWDVWEADGKCRRAGIKSPAYTGPYHGKLIINAPGKKKLMKVHNPVMKSSRTGCQIQLPHPDKLFSPLIFQLLPVFEKILPPAKKGFRVMAAKAFSIQQIKILFREQIYDFPQTGNDSSWENITTDPGIPRMLLLRADKMKKKQTSRLQHLLHCLQKKPVIAPAHMLQHSHTDRPVKGHSTVL